MAYENINLWFAKDKNSNIITVDEVTEENKSTYYCPLCNSEVIPKAIKKNAKITSHFAHIDKSKCNSESMIHWWFKHKYLLAGDKFIVKSDYEQEYICKEVLVEKEYAVGDKTYKPDVTVITECGKTIFFEMAYSNKKKIEEYLDMWIELGNVVVEVDLKMLINSNTTKTINIFNALFYNGKCFNVKKNNSYYNTVGKYKENVYKKGISQEKKDSLRKLDWFWIDTFRYKKGEIDIEYMTDTIESVLDANDKDILYEIIQKPRCNDLYRDYLINKLQLIKKRSFYNSSDDFIYTISNSGLGNYAGELCACFDIKDSFHNRINFYIDFYDGVDDMVKKLNTIINTIKEEYQFKKDLEYANSNLVLTNCIKRVNKYLYSKDNLYMLQSNLKMSNILKLVYNNHARLDIFIDRYILYSQDEDEIYSFIKSRLDEYFIELKPIKNIKEIYNLLAELNTMYQKITVYPHIPVRGGFKIFRCNYILDYKIIKEDRIDFSINYEWMYNSEFGDSFFIEGNSLFRKHNSLLVRIGRYEKETELVKEFNTTINILQLKNLIIELFNKEIQKELHMECKDCKSFFRMELGEVNFYIKNGLSFPKRCKPCRQKKKEELSD